MVGSTWDEARYLPHASSRRSITASIAQCWQRRHSLVRGQSQRPVSEQATVSRPAEQRPGSGRWWRPQSRAAARHGRRTCA